MLMSSAIPSLTIRVIFSNVSRRSSIPEVDDDGLNDGHGGEAVLAGGECIGTLSSIPMISAPKNCLPLPI
jgi:hypothetical protein